MLRDAEEVSSCSLWLACSVEAVSKCYINMAPVPVTLLRAGSCAVAWGQPLAEQTESSWWGPALSCGWWHCPSRAWCASSCHFRPLLPGGGSLASGKQTARWILAVWKVRTELQWLVALELHVRAERFGRIPTELRTDGMCSSCLLSKCPNRCNTKSCDICTDSAFMGALSNDRA